MLDVKDEDVIEEKAMIHENRLPDGTAVVIKDLCKIYPA
jgi:hypothetical protein